MSFITRFTSRNKTRWFFSYLMYSFVLMMLLVVILQNDGQVVSHEAAPSPRSSISNSSDKNVCVKGKSVVTGGFCLSKDEIIIGGNSYLDAKLCKGLEEVFGHATVVDFGAGLGQYGRCFLRINNNVVKSDNPEEMIQLNMEYEAFMKHANIFGTPRVIKSWRGYESAENIEEISSGFINYLDLSVAVDLKERWDWAISIEVGEHIPKDREDAFLDNLAKHACKGIVLSWAVPGQVGLGHINNQYNSHVIEQLKKRGFNHALYDQTNLRRDLILLYLSNSLMVFRADDQTKCH